MNFHSTAVTIADVSDGKSGGNDVCFADKTADILSKLHHLQANHVWLRQRLTDWQRQALTERFAQQSRIRMKGAKLEKTLRLLQAKYNRKWNL